MSFFSKIISAGPLVGALLTASVALAQTPQPDPKGTPNDPTVGTPSAPASVSGPAAAVSGAPTKKDTTIPGTLPGDHAGSARDAGSKGK